MSFEPEHKRILFVDDDAKVLDGLRRMLFPMRKEWEMIFVTGVSDALTFMGNTPVDVVVTDMRMPGHDGAELLEQIVQLYPETVRIVLSGQWDQQMSLRSAKSAHQYLEKPCGADALKTVLDRVFALRRILQGDALKRLIAGLTTLPSLPLLYRRLLDLLALPNTSANEIGDVIATDIGMSAKVLQLANSAFFGVPRRISHPADAAIYLGADTIKALVLTAGVFSQFDGCAPKTLSIDSLQRHSLEVARIAQRIAKVEKLGRQCIDDSFIAGLMHDVGKLILVTKDSVMYDRAVIIARKENLRLDDVEREVFGASHGEVGSYLLWLWGLPDPVTEAVAFHHRPSNCPTSGIGPLALVHAANALANQTDLDEPFLESVHAQDHLPEWRALALQMFETGESA